MAILESVVKEDSSKELTKIWGRPFQGEGTASAKALGWKRKSLSEQGVLKVGSPNQQQHLGTG